MLETYFVIPSSEGKKMEPFMLKISSVAFHRHFHLQSSSTKNPLWTTNKVVCMKLARSDRSQISDFFLVFYHYRKHCTTQCWEALYRSSRHLALHMVTLCVASPHHPISLDKMVLNLRKRPICLITPIQGPLCYERI